MTAPAKRRSLVFTGPGRVEVTEEARPSPGPGQVLVETECTAVSAGTELLVFRGQAPREMSADSALEALSGSLEFPLKYGYSAVGPVTALGEGVDEAWRGRRVFAFHPHESHFLASPADLLEVPPGVPPEAAALLPNMETAVNLLHDGRPLVGERVAVFGQGIVGLLATALLARIPLADLVTFDLHPARREASLRLGARASLDPEGPDRPVGFDLTYEVSGHPAALDQALAATGFSGRVVIGSWYGTKRASLDLGGAFHRSRIRILASQVSTLDPALTGAWTKARRLETAMGLLAEVRPEDLVTHRIPARQAPDAYALLDRAPSEAIQVVLTW